MAAKQDRALFRMMFLRMAVPSMAILLVFLALVSLIFQLSAAHNRQTRMDYQRTRVQEGVRRVEDEMQAIEYAQRSVMNSASMRKFAYMYDDYDWYTRYQLQDNLREQLFNLRNAHRFVKSAWLYLPSMGKVISDTRASTDAPDWLALLVSQRELSYQSVQGMLVNTITWPSGTGEALVYLVVVVDEVQVAHQLDYLLNAQDDLMIMRWGDDGIVNLAGKLQPDALERDELVIDKRNYVNIAATGAQLPMTLHYLAGSDSTDAFVQRVSLILWVFAVGVLLIEALSLLIWYLQVYKPLHLLLIDAFGQAERGDLTYRISIKSKSAFHPVYESYNAMMDRMEAYVEKDLKQQILMGRANLKQLQAQISPHFMYNSYYVLYRLIKRGDQQSSAQLAEHLGQFYHYVTRNADDEKRLVEEVEHARVYAQIQGFRFQSALQVDIEAPPPSIAQVYVPRLILQPLLENAFQYAYESNQSGGAMRLNLHYNLLAGSAFEIVVENSGAVSDETIEGIHARLESRDDATETTALVNIHRRLRIYYSGDSGLRVERSPLGGLMVRMYIERDNGEWED